MSAGNVSRASFNQTRLFGCLCVGEQGLSVPTFLERKVMAEEKLAKASFSTNRQLRAQSEAV